jgi:hypothetical protein
MALILLSADDLKKLPPMQMLGSTHFVAKGLNIVYGPSGTYKSFYTLGLALEIAQSAAVIYVAAEGSSGLSKRIESWCDYKKCAYGGLYFICQEIDLLDDAAVTDLIIKATKKFTKVDLIIFDTYARCIPGGDENSAKDSGLAIRSCARIQRRLKTAVLLVHHSNRAERGERGSGALRGGADSMIEVSHQNGIIKIECSKMKDAEPWQPEYYRFKQVGDSGLLLPAGEVEVPVALTQKEAKILELLSFHIFEKCGATSRQIADALDIRGTTLFRILSNLKVKDYLRQHTKGDPLVITDSGRQILKTAMLNAPPELQPEDALEIEVED